MTGLDRLPPDVAEPEALGRTVGGAGFNPKGMGRADRRRAAHLTRQLEATARKQQFRARRQELSRARAEARQTQYLPSGGERGPDALRSWRRFRVPAHRATSDVLGCAYPFLADAGLGPEGIPVGYDSWSGSVFCFDPWVLYRRGMLTNPNMVLAGVIGRGKSTLAKSLAARSVAVGRRVYVPGDPKGEWSTVAQTLGGQTIALGGRSGSRLNPLDEGPVAIGGYGVRWQAETRRRRRSLLGSLAESVLGRPLEPTEHTALDAALDTAVAGAAVPTLPLVVDRLFDPTGDRAGSSTAQLRVEGRQVAHALARLVHGDLAGLFDGPSTIRFDPDLPMVTLDLSGVSGSDTLIGLVMTCASTWMEAALSDPAAGKRWMIYDEAWRLLHQPALLARMQSQWKLSRALGIANLMIIHRLSDLDAVGDANSQARNLAQGLLADCSTKIIYAQEHAEAARTGQVLGLSTTEVAQLPGLEQGEGLWRVGHHPFMVHHTCTAAELACFDTDARMLADPSREQTSGADAGDSPICGEERIVSSLEETEQHR
jgi:hypothetical protein